MQGLIPFGKNIWIADGPNVRDTGLLFTTRMTVIRLSDGSVWVESPVTLPAETLEQIKTIGPPRYIVASTQRHVWRLNRWHDLFPDAQLWAPTGAAFTLGAIQVPVNDVFTDTPAEGWAEDLEQLAFKGSTVLREVMFFHRESRSVIVGDLVQINPKCRLSSTGGCVPEGRSRPRHENVVPKSRACATITRETAVVGL